MTIKETVRRDGLRMVSCNIPTQTRVLVGISARVGSAHDPANRQGLFHYFEHMAFKGTAHRNVKQIQDFINRNLLYVNATTYRTRTEYWGVAVYRKLALACDFVTDLYAHSTFPVAEIRKEKGPVLLEAARNKDDDGYLADLALRQLLYAKNPLRQFSTGTEDGIKSITRNDLLREKAKWYAPANTVAVAVGRVSHAAFVKEIEKRIPAHKMDVMPQAWDPEFEAMPSRSREIIERRDRRKSTIVMGCKMPDRVSDRADNVEDFLVSLLVSGWSSRLWNEVREKRGLAYTASGGITRYGGLGAYFDAFVQTRPGKEALVEKLMRKALFTPVTADDRAIFEATRESVNDAITAGFGENLGAWNALIHDKIEKGESVLSIKRYAAEQRAIVNNLTLREAEKIRRDFFRPERFATVIVKPARK
jgi:predicted Zn-dependent peptidase